MISTADFLEKQIAIINSDQRKDLFLRNENIVVKQNNKIVNQLSCSKLFCLFIVGDCTISTKLVDKLLSYQVNIYYLKDNLKPRFLLGTALEGNYILRSKQYNPTIDNFTIARQIICNKIANQLILLKELRNKDDKIQQAINIIKDTYSKATQVDNSDSLRGLEGTAAKVFFSSYFQELGRYKRMPRTRNDIINLLMDIGYSMIYNIVEANLNLYGFDIYKGVYHTLFFERKSLVCDLVEPFRCLIDRQIRKIYNLKQINEKEFKFSQQEYSILLEHRAKYMKLLLAPILEHKQAIFEYIKNYYRCIMSDDTTLQAFYIIKPGQ